MYDIISWKNPALTAAALVFFNIAFLVYRSMHLSLTSLILYKTFAYAVFALFKYQVLGQKEICGCLNDKESIEKVYFQIYDKTNKTLDKLRRIILLQEIPSLIRVRYFIN